MSNKNRIQQPRNAAADQNNAEPVAVENIVGPEVADSEVVPGDVDTSGGVFNTITPVADPAPVAPVAVPEAKQEIAIVGASTPVVPHGDFELSLGASVAARLAIQELKDYVEEMSAKRIISNEKGAAAQNSLYRALVGIVNAPADDFKEVMTLALKIIDKHSDNAFNAKNVFRFMPHLNMAPPIATSFRLLANLFTALADPRARNLAIKQINFDATLEHRAIKEDSRQRVMGYFNASAN